MTVSALNISDNKLIALDDTLADNDDHTLAADNNDTLADDNQAPANELIPPADEDDDTLASNIQGLMDKGYQQDKLLRKVLNALHKGKPESNLLVLRDCENRGG